MSTNDINDDRKTGQQGPVKLAPSILAADFSRLGEEIASVYSADMLHVDVMDGHFVPNITFGPSVVNSLRKVTDLPLDVHLMIEDPDRYILAFAEAGASIITVSAEACRHLHRTVHHVKDLNVKVGVAINPATSISVLDHVLEDLDQVLVMTVNPGFGGQSFIASMVPKIRQLRQSIQERNLATDVEVDGGIDDTTAGLVCSAGANVLVAGSYVFGAANRDEALQRLRTSCE